MDETDAPRGQHVFMVEAHHVDGLGGHPLRGAGGLHGHAGTILVQLALEHRTFDTADAQMQDVGQTACSLHPPPIVPRV